MNTRLFTPALRFQNCRAAAVAPSEDVTCWQGTVLVIHVTTRLAFQLQIACRPQDDQPPSRIHQTRDVHTNCRQGQSRTYDVHPKGSLMLRFEVLNTPYPTAYCTYQPPYHPNTLRCPHTVYYRISRELTIIAVNNINQLASFETQH
jgi:hypothetical protein